jgi:hypothetical protein
VEQADVTRDGEEEIVIEGRQLRQLILQHLRRCFGSLAFLLDLGLNSLREYLVWELP